MKRSHCEALAFAALLALAPIRPVVAAVSWSGAVDTSWANGKNWSNNTGPSPTDTAFFGDAGASSIPGDTSNLLDADRTIGGLAYGAATHYQTTDLGGHTLTLSGDL